MSIAAPLQGLVSELCGTQYQSGSFSLINVGVVFQCPRLPARLFLFLFLQAFQRRSACASNMIRQ